MSTTLKHLTNNSSTGVGLPCEIPSGTTAVTVYQVPVAKTAQISLITVAIRMGFAASGANSYLMVCHVPAGGTAGEGNVIRYIDLLSVSATTLVVNVEIGVGLIMEAEDLIQLKQGTTQISIKGSACVYGVELGA